jgi:hypothetical protein
MLRPLAYVTGHKPRGSSGSPPERGAQGKVWTRASTRPLLMLGSPRPGALPWSGPYSEGPGAHPRDPTCLLGSSGLYAQGSGVPLWRSGSNDASWGVLSFLATWCP